MISAKTQDPQAFYVIPADPAANSRHPRTEKNGPLGDTVEARSPAVDKLSIRAWDYYRATSMAGNTGLQAVTVRGTATVFVYFRKKANRSEACQKLLEGLTMPLSVVRRQYL